MNDSQLKSELEYALAANVSRVNPSDRANRFGSGAAVEWILAALAYNAGVVAAPAGHNSNGFDLRDLRKQSQQLWSIKNTTQPRSEFRISNGMGGPGRGFVDPIIMLSPGLPGLTFADPRIHTTLADKAKITSDAVLLPFQAVLEHANSRPECVAACKMPINQGEGNFDPWMDYVDSLLDPVRFPKLATMFKAARPVKTSIIDNIKELAKLRDDGILSDVQFDTALAKLTSTS